MTDLIERLQAASRDDRLADGMLYREAADEIERLRKQKQIAVDALFKICQNDLVFNNRDPVAHLWGIGPSLAEPAHKAIKALAAFEVDHERERRQ